MKSKIIFGVISLLLVLPLTGQALSIDSVMLNYIKTLKERIHTLEVENAQLKDKQCLGTVMIPKKKVEKKEQTILATVSTKITSQDEEGYNLDLTVEGTFDTAYLIVKDPSNYPIATVHIKRTHNVVNFNALQKGTYTYTVESKKGSENSFVSGKFDI